MFVYNENELSKKTLKKLKMTYFEKHLQTPAFLYIYEPGILCSDVKLLKCDRHSLKFLNWDRHLLKLLELDGHLIKFFKCDRHLFKFLKCDRDLVKHLICDNFLLKLF